ncbi:MFS transporter [Pseudoduganella albidiflava]|uniref:MFS transporter n=1 Tax=Pseudoduganella albidiflava TaxID=321983 RepID=A0A411X893_9BURK|nr:MFS transporter [Pseudoduganella albidiflava]QBI05209.1 MFS transporter [Pseudoduganella albidiflava]GGY64409.1 putative MFS-type transporter YdeR [Pseudoduganella albidiflava]
MVWLMATATGLIVANLYYAQPLVGPISQATGLDPGAAGLIVTLTQMGYCLGMIFIVPLGDLVENRRLIVMALAGTACALAVAAFSTSAVLFLAAMFCIGLGSVAAQVIVPFASHLAKPETRGQTVGTVVSGLMLGIMLARPVASLVTDALGWHAIFVLSALVTAGLALVLRRRLPRRDPAQARLAQNPSQQTTSQQTIPAQKTTYLALLASLWFLLKTTPILRRRSAYQFCMFGAFSLFWTTVPLILASPAFGLSQSGIAIFALVGVAGALASPIAGRRADQGKSRSTTAVALVAAALSLAAPLLLHGGRMFELGLLVVAAIVLDGAVSASLVTGQRALYALSADVRSRLNGLYMAIFFMGGALGSSAGGWMYAHHGWQGVLMAGLLFPAAGLLVFSTERK